jgi:transglutaminase-like putative cysteine protease
VGQGALPRIPVSAYQDVEAVSEGAARVTVDLGAERASGAVDLDAHLAATTYANAEDEVIVALVQEALRGAGASARERAEALRRFVFRHIRTKDLGRAFATASETARSGEGDCSEHGVLLAAMLRAAGIPSRVAAGVVYVDEFAGERGVFGYHMWAQALLETDAGPAWVDLDATLDDGTPFDATHIAFAVSDLAEGGAITSLAGIAPLLGTLEIKVEEVR